MRTLLLALGSLLLAGCMSVPEDIQEMMLPPDGKRPNNYGKAVPAESWGTEGDVKGAARKDAQPFKVVPDQPTIAAVAPVASPSETPEGTK